MLILGDIVYSVACTGTQLSSPYTSHYEKISGEGPNVGFAIAQYNYEIVLHKCQMPDLSHSAKLY